MTTSAIAHPTLTERRQAGKSAREKTPRNLLGEWKLDGDGRDPVGILAAQNKTREPDLIPVRHGRMMVSPFTFYRGAAAIMANDLSTIPTAGLSVQLCGDAHLSNFGVFASPERSLLFDLNDFDETLPGPFEYDVARLAASFSIGSRDNGFTAKQGKAAAAASVAAYREAMAQFAAMGALDVWYSRVDANELIKHGIGSIKNGGRKAGKRAEKGLDKARGKNSLQALSKLTELVDGEHRIISDPPILVPGRELFDAYGIQADQLSEVLHEQLRGYRATLPDDRRFLLERFEFVDFARKVVGVGSVGTRAWIALLRGRDGGDPLFLQIKEATKSVLEGHLPKSAYRRPGERVVQGQRLMQAASDIFLGWTKGVEANRYYYWRQLRDMKGSAEISAMDVGALSYYANACGWTLARAHARSGDPVAISAYLGKSSQFDDAMTTFATRYADQNEIDYNAFAEAIRSGKIPATDGI